MAKGLNRKNRGQRRNANIIEQPMIVKPKKHLEKKVRVYVVADPETGQYLYKKPAQEIYHFVKDIAQSTKCESRNIAHFIMQCYRQDTGDNLDLVVIPLEITYELINESGEYDYDMDINAEILRRNTEWKKLN